MARIRLDVIRGSSEDSTENPADETKETVGSAHSPVDPIRRRKLLLRFGHSVLAAISLLSGIALGNYVGGINGWLVLVLSVLLAGTLYILPLAWFVRSRRHRAGVRIGPFSNSVIRIASWFVQGALAGEIYDLAYETFVVEPKVTSALVYAVGIITVVSCFVLVVLVMYLQKTVEEDFLVPFSPTLSPRE